MRDHGRGPACTTRKAEGAIACVAKAAQVGCLECRQSGASAHAARACCNDRERIVFKDEHEPRFGWQRRTHEFRQGGHDAVEILIGHKERRTPTARRLLRGEFEAAKSRHRLDNFDAVAREDRARGVALGGCKNPGKHAAARREH